MYFVVFVGQNVEVITTETSGETALHIMCAVDANRSSEWRAANKSRCSEIRCNCATCRNAFSLKGKDRSAVE